MKPTEEDASHTAGTEDFFEMSLDNVCVAGLDGYFKRVNPSWTRTLGWTAEELLAKPSIEFVHPEDRAGVLAGRERLRSGGALGPLVNRYVCRDGTYRWFEWRSVADVGRGLVYATARDITEQKLAEEQLREAKQMQEKLQHQLILADRMASLGTLAAGVGHEINNPLASVTANVAFLIEELENVALRLPQTQVKELRDIANDLQASAERIRRIVRGLTAFSRAAEEPHGVVDLRPILETSIELTLHELRTRARVVSELGPTPLVNVDDANLGQVFVCLLTNAFQAIAPENTDKNEIHIATSTDDAGWAVIVVRDTGCGVPSHLLHRVFEPFFTTKPIGGGTGLGLFICHNVVKALGGEITIASQEGAGTTVRVRLPPAPPVSARS